MDIGPLKRYPIFRRFYLGQGISIVGSMLSVTALQYQAYKLGGDSTLTVATLAAVTLVPFVGASMIGGTIADSIDRRKIMLVCQSLLLALALVLAFNAASSSPRLWVLFVVGCCVNALIGVDWPTRSSVTPTLVGPKDTQKAIALSIAAFNLGGIAGPVIAGFFVQRHSSALYFADAASYAISLFAVYRLPSKKELSQGKPEVKRSIGLSTMVDGFRYLKSQRLIQATLFADLGAMIFGLPDALFPEFAEKVLHSTGTLGFLKAAPAIGALCAGLLSGKTHSVKRQGRAVIVCICIWGLGIALFGATRYLPVALLGLFIAGAADSISAIFRSTIMQVTVPDEYRGRLSSIFVAVVRGGPKLGESESGVAASFGGLQFAAVSGGLLCLVWIAAISFFYPELGNYESRLQED